MFNWVSSITWNWLNGLILIGILVASFYLIRAIIKLIKRIRLGIINRRKLGKKEFWKRFKEGMKDISPTESSRISLIGLWIIEVGLISGTVILPIIRPKGVWIPLALIFLGGIFVNTVGLWGEIIKYRAFKKQDEIMKKIGLENEKAQQMSEEKNVR